jgi:peptide/nickel transport system permease protein
LNPIISLFGLSIGFLVSSSLIVEAIFSWPGLGRLLLQAIADRDLFLIIDSTMVAAGFLIAGNFIADLLLYWSDPRIRAE